MSEPMDECPIRHMPPEMAEVLSRPCYMFKDNDYAMLVRVKETRSDGYCEFELIEIESSGLGDGSIEITHSNDVRPVGFLERFQPCKPVFFGNTLAKLKNLKTRIMDYENRDES